MRWAGHGAGIEEERGVFRVSVGKPEGKKPLGRPRRRWEVIIRIDLQEVGCGVTGPLTSVSVLQQPFSSQVQH
jgi:hypothetical protein